MAVRATLTLVAVSAVTLAGIAVIHINQKTERQARFLACLAPARRELDRQASSLLQALHQGVIRDRELYASKLRERAAQQQEGRQS